MATPEPDYDRIALNICAMLSLDTPEEHLGSYLFEEGLSPGQVLKHVFSRVALANAQPILLQYLRQNNNIDQE